MLVLSRYKHEAIKIGDDVTVTILGMKGGVVSVGTDAPRETPVHREEIAERIAAEQQKCQ